VARPRPVRKLDAELEARLGLADQVILIDAEQADDIDDRRNGRLPDTDGADVSRLDETDAAVRVLEELGENRRRHPPGRSSANDGDPADGIDWHARAVSRQ